MVVSAIVRALHGGKSWLGYSCPRLPVHQNPDLYLTANSSYCRVGSLAVKTEFCCSLKEMRERCVTFLPISRVIPCIERDRERERGREREREREDA